MHRRQQRQRQRQHYRDRYEILRNILFIVANTQPLYRNYMNKMRLAYAVGLTHPQMVEYLGQLLNCGLLIKMEFKPFYSYYEISERGRRCLQLFDELEGDLKPNIDVVQGP
jgi:predicted transcriptional regulator